MLLFQDQTDNTESPVFQILYPGELLHLSGDMTNRTVTLMLAPIREGDFEPALNGDLEQVGVFTQAGSVVLDGSNYCYGKLVVSGSGTGAITASYGNPE